MRPDTTNLKTAELSGVHAIAFAFSRRLDVLRKPLSEVREGVKELGHDEVQQRPQFRHRILDRRSREEQTVAAVEPLRANAGARQCLYFCTSKASKLSTNNVFQRCEALFLTACASSSTIYCHFTRAKCFSSAMTSL